MNLIGISGKKGSGKDTVGKIIQLINSSCKGENITHQDIVKHLKDGKPLCFNSDFEIKKFADKLKDMVCILLSCTREQLENEEFKSTILGEEWWYYVNLFNGKVPYVGHTIGDTSHLVKPTPRLFLQLLGTEGSRELLHPNIWVNSLMSEYRPLGSWVVMNFSIDTKEGVEEHYFYPNWIITDVRFENEANAILDRGGVLLRIERGDPSPKEHISEVALDYFQNFTEIIYNNDSIESLVKKVENFCESTLNFDMNKYYEKSLKYSL